MKRILITLALLLTLAASFYAGSKPETQTHNPNFITADTTGLDLWGMEVE